MKSVCSIVTAVLLVLHSTICAAASVQVLSMKGTVMGNPQGVAASALKPGDTLGSGWMVTTGRNSNVVLVFDDGQRVALQSETTFRIDSYQYDQANPGGSRMWLSLLKGGLRAITGLVASTNRSEFNLRTRVATIGVRGTELMTVDFQDIYTQVLEGRISVSTTGGTEFGAAGDTVLAISSTQMPTLVQPRGYADGLFQELRGIDMGVATAAKAAAAPKVAATTPGGASTGAGAPAGGGGLSGAATATLLILGVAAAGALAFSTGGTTATTTHH